MSTQVRGRAGRAASILLTIAGVAAIVVGAIMVGHPLYTDYLAGRQQAGLVETLETAAAREAFETHQVEEAYPISRLVIPKLGVDTVVVEGTSDEALAAGAGHYSDTPLPGQTGNVAIAGHRTTYGKPFADLDQLEPGDQVELVTPVGSFVYEMVPPFGGHSNPWVIEPTDWSVVGPTPDPMLTLTTCHPKRSDRQRLVARLQLIESPTDRSRD